MCLYKFSQIVFGIEVSKEATTSLPWEKTSPHSVIHVVLRKLQALAEEVSFDFSGTGLSTSICVSAPLQKIVR